MDKLCGVKGDFGHTNLFGEPRIKFLCSCSLKEGHTGKHQAKEKLQISNTYEKYGLEVDRNSIEFTSEITIKWNLKK